MTIQLTAEERALLVQLLHSRQLALPTALSEVISGLKAKLKVEKGEVDGQ